MELKKNTRVMYGGREWIVVAVDPEVDQVRLSRKDWDRSAGAERTIFATPSARFVTAVDR